MAVLTLDVSDLIGLAYRKRSSDPASGALDCWGCAVEVHRRLGHGEVRPDPAAWLALGCDLACARELGDLAVGDSPGGALSVAVLVSQSPKLWLTAIEGHGVQSSRRPQLGTLRGVYRWRGPVERRPQVGAPPLSPEPCAGDQPATRGDCTTPPPPHRQRIASDSSGAPESPRITPNTSTYSGESHLNTLGRTAPNRTGASA